MSKRTHAGRWKKKRTTNIEGCAGACFLKHLKEKIGDSIGAMEMIENLKQRRGMGGGSRFVILFNRRIHVRSYLPRNRDFFFQST